MMTREQAIDEEFAMYQKLPLGFGALAKDPRTGIIFARIVELNAYANGESKTEPSADWQMPEFTEEEQEIIALMHEYAYVDDRATIPEDIRRKMGEIE